MSEEIRIEIVRDKSDFLSASWLNFWRTGKWIFPVAIALIGFVWGFFESVEHGTIGALGGGAATALVCLAVIAFLYSAQMSALASHNYNLPGARDQVTYVFSAASLAAAASVGNTTINWSAFKSAYENRRVLVLQSASGIHVFPKRQIPRQSLRDLKSLLRGVLRGNVSFVGEAAP
jgi:hypothetical protein